MALSFQRKRSLFHDSRSRKWYLERETGLEPATLCLESPASQIRKPPSARHYVERWSGQRESNPCFLLGREACHHKTLAAPERILSSLMAGRRPMSLCLGSRGSTTALRRSQHADAMPPFELSRRLGNQE